MTVIPFLIHAQWSIFTVDTVTFNYYHLDDNDKIKPTIVFSEGISKDTILDHKIYMDKGKQVFWNTGNHGVGEYGLALDLWNIGFHEKDETVRDVAMKIPKEVKSYLPIFKTLKEKNSIIYRTIESNPKGLFKISLSQYDTLKQLPFFMNEGYNSLHLDDLKLTYCSDTTINVKGHNVQCYKFKSMINQYSDDMETFSFKYHEMLIEKSSLLSLSIIERRCYRAYFRPTRNVEDFSGYGINYLTNIIQIR